EVPPAPARLHIGSHEGCQLVLTEPALHRETLEVVHDLEGVLVRSLSGEAVVQLAGQRYKTRRLHDRDELQVGTTRLVFEEPAQHAIDALKGLPDAPVSEAPTASSEQPMESAGRTQPMPPITPSERRGAALASQEKAGPSIAELVIYALAIAVLLASGLALMLLLRAR
ncbi:MAG: hypothetical protein RLZZ450_6139, partial [Pseudomonadota bacterium]